jgi:hypothetical protein
VPSAAAPLGTMADAPSPEEWPKHGGGSACRDLDGAVRCPICGDPFETPLSLRCGHACELQPSL